MSGEAPQLVVDDRQQLGRGRGVAAVDGIQDPGNVGTIIRSSVASGVASEIRLRRSADPYSPKVVRSAAGAIFRIPVKRYDAVEDVLYGCTEPILICDATGTTSIEEFDWSASVTLILGSEGNGASSELIERSSASVRIPISPHAESLNVAVAASIILFEIARQRRSAASRSN